MNTLSKICLPLLFISFISFGLMATPLTGTYTINSSLPTGGTNFASFNAAEDSLTANGVSGPVLILVKQGIYTEQVSFGTITGASSSNTITIKADPTNTAEAKIEYNAATSTATNYVIQFNSAHYFIIDSLVVSSTTGSYGTLVDFSGVSSDIKLINNSFFGSLGSSTSTDYALIAKGSGTSKKIDNLTLENNLFEGGSYGIYIYGGSAGRMNYFRVIDNTITKSVKRFISFNYCSDILIENNHCEDDSARTGTLEGIYVSRADSAVHIRKNTVIINSTSGYIYGIRVSYLFGSITHYTTIENNMVAMTYATIGGQYGIKIENCIYQNIYHNTVKVNHTNPNYSIAFELSGNGSASYGKTNIVNNIFYNGQGKYAFKFNNYSNPYIDSLNYNIYYSTGTGYKYNTTTTGSFATFKTASGKDVNSLTGDPGFTSSLDLHVIGTLADNAGDNSVGVTTDIDNDPRPFSGSTTVDIGADEYSLIACPPPSIISGIEIKHNSSIISWLNGPNDSAWLVEYGAVGFTPGSGTLINSANDTVSIASLTASTCYDVYLRSICPVDTSALVGPFSFCTPCVPSTAPYSEDFATMSNTAPPTCWIEGKTYLGASSKVAEGYSAWTSDDFGNVGTLGTGSARCQLGYTNINDWLVSPLIDLGTGTSTNYQVEFKIAVTEPNGTGAPSGGSIAPDEKIVFLISTDYGTTWSTANILRQWDSTDLPVATGEYFSYNLTAAGYTGVVRFAFYTESTISSIRNEVHVDDFNVDVVPTCPDPSLLVATANSTSSVSMAWTNGSSDVSWLLEHGPVGFTPGTGTITTISTSGAGTINGLTSSSLYDVYLRSICGATDTSRYVGPVKVQTQCVAQSDFCEDFSTVVDSTILPVCWSKFNNSTVANSLVQVDNFASNAYRGSSYLVMNNSTDLTSTFMLISPELSNLAAGTHRANFWSKEFGESGDSSLIIGTMTNPSNPGSFTPFDTINLSTAYSNHKIDFSAYSGTNTYVAFLWLQRSTNDRVYIDEFCWEAIPACEKAFSASVLNSGQDSASLNLGWTTDPAHSSYIIWYGPAGYTPGASTQIGTTTATSNFVTINSLTPLTEYCFWVKSVCSSGDTSAWEGPLCGRTGCPDGYTVPYGEIFSTYIPDCWNEAQGRLSSSNTTFTSTTSSGWNSLPFAYSGTDLGANLQIYGTTTDEWLISPTIDLGSDPNNSYLITFDYALTETGSSNLGVLASDDSISFVISLDNGVTWNQYNTLELWDHTSTFLTGRNNFNYLLRNVSGKVKFGFYASSRVSNLNSRFHIDNFLIDIPVGIEKNTISNTFQVYPNPNDGQFILLNEGETKSYIINVMDMQGRIIYTENKVFESNQSKQIDISTFSKGVYLLQLVSEERTEQHRIVVR